MLDTRDLHLLKWRHVPLALVGCALMWIEMKVRPTKVPCRRTDGKANV